MVDIYMPVVECGFVPFFADVLSIYSCILLFFRLMGKCPTHFLDYIFVSRIIQLYKIQLLTCMETEFFLQSVGCLRDAVHTEY
jgi:hypothetical protein